VQVIEVAEELVETVRGGQELVPIAQVILAELAADVAERLQHVGDRRVLRLKPEIGTGEAYFRQAGPDRRLASNECRTAGGAALLPVPVCEVATLLRNPVDVRGAIPHDPVVVHADVEPPDVVPPDD